jgi:hypothetical protein
MIQVAVDVNPEMLYQRLIESSFSSGVAGIVKESVALSCLALSLSCGNFC